MNKKIFFLFTSVILVIPIIASAAGLVPCGGPGEASCQFCHFVTLIQNVFTWLVMILFIVVAIIFMVAGLKLVTSGGNPSEKTAAKKIITNAFIGFVIVLAVWLLVDLGMKMALKGGTGATSIGPWNSISCVAQPKATLFVPSSGLINGAIISTNCTPTATGFDCTAQTAACTSGGGTPTVNTTNPTNQTVDCSYPQAAYSGSCSPITDPSNPCNEANLTMFGDRAADASLICNRESGGAPVKSNSDLCCGPDGDCNGAPSFSGGYFQINILSNAGLIPGCTPGAFSQANGSGLQGDCVRYDASGSCTGYSCTITDTAIYNECMKATTDAALNLQIAGQLYNKMGFKPWANSASICLPLTGSGGGSSTINACSAGAAGDPGFGTGTWRPSGMTNVWVFDNSGGISAFPGCINAPFQWNCPSVSPTGFSMAEGHVAAIRYVMADTIPDDGLYLRVDSGTGSGIPANVTMSLSTLPNNFSTAPECMVNGVAGGSPHILVGGSGCKVTPGSLYYLNVKTTSDCSAGWCRFIATAGPALQGTTVSCTTTSGSGSGSGSGSTGGTASCSAGAPGDAGFGGGTWTPPGMPNVRVFDQSGPNGVGDETRVPGCVNGATSQAGCPITLNGYALGAGGVAAIRYITTSPIPATGQYITLASTIASGIQVETTISFSTRPNDFSNPACTTNGRGGTTPQLLIGGTGCPVTPGSLYYLNIKPAANCLGGCAYKIKETSFIQGTTVSCTPGGTPQTTSLTNGSCPAPATPDRILSGRTWVNNRTENGTPVRTEATFNANNTMTLTTICRLSAVGRGVDLAPQVTVPIGSMTGTSYQVLATQSKTLTNAAGYNCTVQAVTGAAPYTATDPNNVSMFGLNFETRCTANGGSATFPTPLPTPTPAPTQDPSSPTDLPPFPWTIDGQTYNSLPAVLAAFPNMGIVVDGTTVSIGGVVVGYLYGTSSGVCSAGAPGDPGYGTGTWRLAGLNVWVVDQSSPNGAGGNTALPGCPNGINFSYNCPSVSPDGMTLDDGHVVAVRYIAGEVPDPGQYLTVYGGQGSGTGVTGQTTISLSTVPNDFATAAVCTQTASPGGSPRILIGGAGCQVVPGSLYYLNIRSDSGCTGGSCRVSVVEPTGFGGTAPSCTAAGGGGTGTGGGNTTPPPPPPATPAFPWTIHGTVYTSLAAVQADFAPDCVNIDGVRVVSGFGPCVSGTSGSGASTPAPVPPPAAPPGPVGIYSRVFYDGFESGNANAWTRGYGTGNIGLCPVGSSALDGGVGPHSGSKMAICNWNGQDPSNPDGAGHSYTALQKVGWPKNRESLIRFWFRVDSDVDNKKGSKLFRAPGDTSYAAIQFEQGNNASLFSTIYKSNVQQIGSTNWGCGGNFRNGGWHKIEIYLKESTGGASNGEARIWTDGALCWEALNQNTDDPRGAGYWAEFEAMSNWSISEVGWDHDKNNHIYWDDVEIFSDSTSGTPTSGTLSNASVVSI